VAALVDRKIDIIDEQEAGAVAQRVQDEKTIKGQPGREGPSGNGLPFFGRGLRDADSHVERTGRRTARRSDCCWSSVDYIGQKAWKLSPVTLDRGIGVASLSVARYGLSGTSPNP